MLNKQMSVLPSTGAAGLTITPVLGVTPVGMRPSGVWLAAGVGVFGTAAAGGHGTALCGAGDAAAYGHHGTALPSDGNAVGSGRITGTVPVFVAVGTRKAVRDRVDVDVYVRGVPPRGAPV
jgi:hypothetical protein